MNLKSRVAVFFAFLLSVSVCAQKDSVSAPRTLSVMLGYGRFGALETYLSPYKYSGTDYRLIAEIAGNRQALGTYSLHRLNLNYSQLTNLSGRGLYHAGFLNYSYARNYSVLRSESLRCYLGPAVSGNFGAIYNVRNDNNPVQVKAFFNLELANAEEYRFKVRSIPFALKYELRIPLVGAGFAPEYGASYYEMFQLGNTSGIVHLLSLHNQWAMQNMLTLEVPVWGNRLKIGYYNNIYQTRINSLETSLSAHNLVVGFSGDFANIRRGVKIKR